jgi:acetolactate synthase-1/2/3 large subunit
VPRYGTDLYVGEYFQADTFMGAPVYRAASTQQMETCIEKALQQDGPVIVEAVVDGTEYKELISKKYK